MKKHREQFLRDLRSKLCPDGSFVGYAWKLEYGLEKNYHYHAIIFLDGSKVRQDVTIAITLGRHWADTVTGGRGLYFNCNAIKEGYRHCGIGMINHNEKDKRDALMNAAAYLTKVDYYLKVVTPDCGKTFSKGKKPERKTLGKGRPRKLL